MIRDDLPWPSGQAQPRIQLRINTHATCLGPTPHNVLCSRTEQSSCNAAHELGQDQRVRIRWLTQHLLYDLETLINIIYMCVSVVFTATSLQNPTVSVALGYALED
jgi:hypothetical protein